GRPPGRGPLGQPAPRLRLGRALLLRRAARPPRRTGRVRGPRAAPGRAAPGARPTLLAHAPRPARAERAGGRARGRLARGPRAPGLKWPASISPARTPAP